MDDLTIVTYDDQQHRDQVVALWQAVFGYDAPHNDPQLVIDKKLGANDALLILALRDKKVVGTVMAGYDGHRGWIYSLAVVPALQKQGIGALLLRQAEERLAQLGCMKINLQITEGNEGVERFYQTNGYSTEKRISMGKRIPANIKY